MDGYFYEQGPYHVQEPLPATGPPQLYLNPNRVRAWAGVLRAGCVCGVCSSSIVAMAVEPNRQHDFLGDASRRRLQLC